MEIQIITHSITLIAGIALGMYITTQISKCIDKNNN